MHTQVSNTMWLQLEIPQGTFAEGCFAGHSIILCSLVTTGNVSSVVHFEFARSGSRQKSYQSCMDSVSIGGEQRQIVGSRNTPWVWDDGDVVITVVVALQ